MLYYTIVQTQHKNHHNNARIIFRTTSIVSQNMRYIKMFMTQKKVMVLQSQRLSQHSVKQKVFLQCVLLFISVITNDLTALSVSHSDKISRKWVGDGNAQLLEDLATFILHLSLFFSVITFVNTMPCMGAPSFPVLYLMKSVFVSEASRAFNRPPEVRHAALFQPTAGCFLQQWLRGCFPAVKRTVRDFSWHCLHSVLAWRLHSNCD